MVERVPPMVDLRRTPQEQEEAMEIPSIANAPEYPYGLSISLCQDELEKLNLEDEDFEVGDLVHFHAMAVVTSISSNATQSGQNCRVELQITHMSAEDEEDEDEENEEEEDAPRLHKLYS